MWDETVYECLNEKRHASMFGGGIERTVKQHDAGKLTARERLDLLFDPQSFHEVGGLAVSRYSDRKAGMNSIPGDGVITGYGKINGRLVFASSEDFTVKGGTLGEVHAMKICQIQDMALNSGAPIIMMNDGGGARIEEGLDALGGYAGIFLRNTEMSGVIPQIAVIMGPCAGGACYSPAICDFIFMVENTSYMFITGPQVLKTVAYESVSKKDLGGTEIHSTKSGVAHFTYPDDRTCLENVRKILGYLPQNNRSPWMPATSTSTPIDRCDLIPDIVPQNPRKGYDVRSVIETMADEESFMEVQPGWARNAVIGLGRLDGLPVGFVANQPSVMAGVLDCDASDKMARFIRTCDCFNIPLIVLVDTAAYLPGVVQEHNGIIRHGAKLLYAFSEATVPKISLIMRKAYGGAYIAMNSKRIGADVVYAWPIAELAVMGAEGAVEILNRQEIKADPESRETLVREYEKKYMNPYLAAERGYVDEVIDPKETRVKIAAALEMLRGKEKAVLWKKHGNIPL